MPEWDNGMYLEDRKIEEDPHLVPERIDPERPFFVNFVAFEEEFARLSERWGKKHARNHMIIRRTFGIHCRKMVMELVGTNHDLTRERVRQIKAHSLVMMRKMLSGKTVRQPRRECPAELVRQFLSFQQEHVSNRSVILRSGIVASDPRVKDVSEPYIDLLMAVLGYETATYREHDLFYDTERFNQQTLRASITAVFRSVRDELFPMSASAVAKRVKAENPDMGFTGEVVQNILEEIPDFEYVTVDERSGFQLCIHKFSNTGTMALRILRDAGTPMHYREFVRAVNQCRIRSGEGRIVSFPAVVSQLIKSEHASPVGKTGYWVLKEWNIDG